MSYWIAVFGEDNTTDFIDKEETLAEAFTEVKRQIAFDKHFMEAFGEAFGDVRPPIIVFSVNQPENVEVY